MIKIQTERLGIPQNSRDAFELLNQKDIIDEKMLEKLKAMIGFRNIAVHNYQNLNLDILQKIVENHLEDFQEFIYRINEMDE